MAGVTHKCDKEKEIVIMATEIKAIKSDLSETRSDVKETKTLILELPQRILDLTDAKYVHKGIFEEFEKRFDAVNNRQDSDITWNKTKIIGTLIKVASIATSVAVLGKLAWIY